VQGIEQAAAARRQLAAGEIDGQAFADATRQHLGVELPPDWSGELRIVGVAEQDGQTVDAAQAGIEPQAFQVYARKAERQYINVPYREKDEAKGLGARWDRQKQSWYVPLGTDTAPFAKWAQGAATAAVEPRSWPAPEAQGEAHKPAQQAPQARQYLAVPYEQRNAARAAGALWDKAAKSWYVGPRADAV